MKDDMKERHARLLLDHAALLLEHALEIQARPELASCEVHCVRFGGLFLPVIDVRLGSLLAMWRSGLLRLPIDGGEPAYVYAVGGSALSGEHGAVGVDLRSNRRVCGRMPSDIRLVDRWYAWRRACYGRRTGIVDPGGHAFEHVIDELGAR